MQEAGHTRRFDVLGVRISNTTPRQTLDQIRRWVEDGERSYVCFTPVSGVMAARRDPSVRAALNGAGLTAPDGMPIVWAGRYAGASDISRVYGPDLMSEACALSARRGWKTFLYGGSSGVADRLAARLLGSYPELEIVGTETPPFRSLEEKDIELAAEQINRSGAEIVWVGLPTPKQDLLMSELLPRLDRPVVLLGVGAAFDLHSGRRRKPPSWLGPLGLFWAFRLLQEPRRLWRRYLYDIPRFALEILRRPPTPVSAATPTRADT